MSDEPRGTRDVDEALKAKITPEFDAEFKRLHAASRRGAQSRVVMASEMGTQLITTIAARASEANEPGDRNAV